jgi:hypothetical protein
MKLWLFQHSWKSVRRSPDFQRKVVVNVLFGFMMAIIALELLLAGFYLNRIVATKAPPGRDAVDVVNSILIFYFGIDFVLRLVFQKLRTTSTRHYLLQRVSKEEIAHFVLVKTLGTMINILPPFIIVPFFFTGVASLHLFLPSTAWMMTILALMVFNTYLASYATMKFFTNSVRTSLAFGALIAVVVLERLNIFSFSSFSTLLFGSLLLHPALAVVPLLAAAGLYAVNYRFLKDHLYLEDTEVVKKAKPFREYFPFLAGFGEIAPLISLDLKLMMRNKRARVSLWMPFLMVFYGLFFYPRGHYSGASVESDFTLIFIGSFITGFFIVSYGLTTFCYESRHFGLILTNRINMFTYLKARYFFMLLMTLPVYLISLFYVYFGMRIFMVNSVMFLFNIGITAFFFLYLSTFNKIKFDLSAGYYSMQGKGSNQFLAVFLMMILVAVPFLTFRWLMGVKAGFIGLGLLGVVGFVYHNLLLAQLLKQFERRKYIMSEGFRES